MLKRVLGEGGYRQFDDELGLWWVRSGIAGFAKDASDHFYLPECYTDPFGNVTTLTFDKYDLYIRESTDPAKNTVSVTNFDFRVLAPLEMQDINENRSEVYFDTLGMPAAVAVKGKGTEGDNLEGVCSEISDADLIDFFMGEYDPDKARAFLGNATARHLYYFGDESHPACAAGLVREKHVAQLAEGEISPLQAAFEYSDGMGAVLVKKIQAEPENSAEPLRWIATGKTVLNNKGKAVKQYEPYFSTDENEAPNHRFEEPHEQGVTPILYYDAPGRQVRVEMPDGTLSRVEFSPWFTRAFDANDTILESRWLQEIGKIPSDWEYEKELSPNVDAQKRAAFLAILHANTPTETHLDSLGREVLAIAHNYFRRPLNNHFEKTEEKYLTYTHLDTEGKALWIQDARGNIVMRYTLPAAAEADPLQDFCPAYDLAGNLLYQHSMDAGDRWMLPDTAGQPLYAWDVNDHWENGEAIEERRIYHNTYDELRRPKEQYLRINDNPLQLLIEQTIYGEKGPDNAVGRNLRGQIWRHYDPGGLITNQRFDFKGNLLEIQRQMPSDYKANIVDWSMAQLETEVYTLITEYDALNRMSKLYNWHRDKTEAAVYEPKYSERGVLLSEDLTIKGQKTTVVKDITYDAKGQRLRMRYGNGTTTCYHYDPQTFRLIQLRTTKYNTDACERLAKSNLNDLNVYQNLFYTYDPVGNITEIYDDAYKPVFFKGQKVLPQNTYEYDALYQLISATGREHYKLPAPTQRDFDWPPQQFDISDETLRGYTEQYQYDGVGNILKMQHIANGGSWTRNYQYATDSNRLIATEMGSSLSYPTYSDTPTLADHYTYDVHGSMTHIGNASANLITWDYRDMIQQYDLGGGGFAYYQYSSDKQRSRKVIEKQGNIKEERLYLGGMERYRRWRNGDTNPEEEIETYHVFEGEQRILMVEDVIKTPPDGINKEGVLFCYQYSNHLGSSCVEMDQDAEIISYEEYHPYGTTAYHSMNKDIQAAAKRYRYTGMERDEETGLAYHTARYYLAWLGRWGSCDPKFMVDGVNIFVYANNSPTKKMDIDGTNCNPENQSCPNPIIPTLREDLLQQS
ncbi:MAG TPA: RHS repeat-associated core domain-containing protein, partial [Saprospiraceae bacterium]|nr:RHS repeat-associated core domain-containing protein [Saprospiraceae bacterium]